MVATNCRKQQYVETYVLYVNAGSLFVSLRSLKTWVLKMEIKIPLQPNITVPSTNQQYAEHEEG